MDDQLDGNGQKAAAWIVTIVIAATGVYWYQTGFHTSRPEMDSWKASQRFSDEPVEARLWEDPIAAINKQGDIKAIDLKALHEQIEKRQENMAAYTPPDEQRKSIRVLIVPTNTRRYAEDVEDRVRERVAVISALGVANFVPEEPAAIGCAEIRWESPEILLRRFDTPTPTGGPLYQANLKSGGVDSWNSGNGAGKVKAPYEWFRTKIHAPNSPLQERLEQKSGKYPERPGAVLVLWVDEEYFNTEPLSRLAYLVQTLRHGYFALPSKANLPVDRDSKALTFYYLGPSTSSSLRRIIPWRSSQTIAYDQEDNQDGRPLVEVRKILKPVHIVNWGASIQEELLIDRLQPTQNARPMLQRWDATQPMPPITMRSEVHERLQGYGPKMRSVVCSDSILAEQILWELKRRNVNATDPKDHLVFISEWDTEWGRLVPLAFAHHVATDPNHINRGKYPLLHQWPKNFHHFAYLRGLDGRSSANHGSANGDDSEKGKESGSKKEVDGKLQPPAGPSQIDSVPRLVQSLQSLSTELHGARKGNVRAIGVLGSDTYDKLLILQALRRYMPEAIVFTTELDARYWHPAELKATRNLLVASSYGLQLHPDIQSIAPPFRDSRQTALFNASLAALLLSPDEERRGRYRPFEAGPPHMFEIGYGGPVDISMWSPRDRDTLKYSLHPMLRESLGHGWRTFAGSTFLALMIAGVGWCLLRRLLPGWEKLSGFEEAMGAILLRKEQVTDPATVIGNLHHKSPQVAGALRLPIKRTKPQLAGGGRARRSWLVRLFQWIGSGILRLFHRPQIKEMPLTDSDYVIKLNDYIQGPRSKAGTYHRVELWFVQWFRSWFACSVSHHRRCRTAGVNELIPCFTGDLEQRKQLEGMLKKRMHLEACCGTAIAPVSRRLRYIHLRRRIAGRTILWASIFGLLLVAAIVHDHFYYPGGEPFALLRGISTWPTDILLFATIVFSLWAIFDGMLALHADSLDLAERYCLDFPDEPALPKIKNLSLAQMIRGCLNALVEKPSAWRTRSGAAGRSATGNEIWSEYMKRSLPEHFLKRLVRPLTLYILLGIALILAFGLPHRPTRGWLNGPVDWVLLVGALFASAALTFYIVDAAGRCRKLIDIPCPYSWSEKTKKRIREYYHFKGEEIAEWVHVRIITDRAAAVDRLVYYPLVAIALGAFAHSRIFDYYPLSIPLLTLAIINVIFAVFAMVKLGQAARAARTRAVDSLRHELISGTDEPTRSNRRQRIELAIKDLEDIRKGVFATTIHRPFFAATSMIFATIVFRYLDLGMK